MTSVNRAVSVAATMAGAVLVAAPGAGKRILITAAWCAGADDANVNAWQAIQGTFGGAPAIIMQSVMPTFMPGPSSAGVGGLELLCDENTGLIATRAANSGNSFCGVHYRIVNGTGTS